MRRAGIFVGGVLVVALALFGYKKYGNWQNGRLVKWRADSARVADDTRVATLAAAKADTVYLQARGGYVAQRARVLGSGTATPREKATIAACDEVQRTCDERHAADSIEKASLRTELAVARAKPTMTPRRFMIGAEGLYDLLNAAPVLRANTELRIVGPISLKAEGELAIPSAGQCQTGKCGVTMRGLVGVRYVF